MLGLGLAAIEGFLHIADATNHPGANGLTPSALLLMCGGLTGFSVRLKVFYAHAQGFSRTHMLSLVIDKNILGDVSCLQYNLTFPFLFSFHFYFEDNRRERERERMNVHPHKLLVAI